MSIKLAEGKHVLHVGAVRDAAGVDARPGVVVVRDGEVFYAGSEQQVDRDMLQDLAEGAVHRFPDLLIMPGMVNAHAHLSMTPLGCQPYAGTFTGWLLENSERLKQYFADGGTVAKAVEQGVGMLEASGVVAVGDVTLRVDAFAASERLAASELAGVSHIEILSPGGDAMAEEFARLEQVVHRVREEGDSMQHDRVRLGLQPHAPYSTLPALYQACVDVAVSHGLPIMTHLAEMPEEAEYVRSATGAFRTLIENLGQWSPDTAAYYQTDQSPVQWAQYFLEQAPFIAAHCNYVSDTDIAILAATNTSVAYCPVASDYFGHRDHRYRDMLAAGVNVCLGSDSVVCFDPNEPQPLSVLTAMRHLHRRDHAPPQTLLAMATTHGTAALHLDPTRYGTLAPGSLARFAAVRFNPSDPTDALEQVLASDEPVETITSLRPMP